jgi:hypothetical protein
MLLEVWQQSALSTYESCQRQIDTQLKCISSPDRSNDPAELIREMEQSVLDLVHLTQTAS